MERGMSVLILLGVSVSLAEARCYEGGSFKAPVWPHCHEASSQLSVYSGLSDDGQFVKLGLHAQGHSKGWSAIGFSGNGGMKGASQIVVRLNQNDEWVAEDRYSLDYVEPTLDPKQDVQLLFAQDNGVNTSWGVVIPKNSCDENDYSVENVSRVFLWALGATHAFTQHVTRGQFHANLIHGSVPFVPLTDVTEVALKMPNVTVVSKSSDASNPYICGIFDLRELFPTRNLSQAIHVAKFSPYLAAGSAQYVHHMILYGCGGNDGFTHNGIIEDCQSMPAGCNAFKWVWAVGGRDVQLPDNVGMPLGNGNFFVALQMHYYNPLKVTINDTSGVTLSVTTTNRAIDAAILQLNGGVMPFQRAALPPNASRFTLPPFVVPNTCTNAWEEPINIVGAIHHMHMVGVHQQIEIARNGTHLGLLRDERIYDFNHQSLEEPMVHQLLPGDEIKMSCDYDTTGKAEPTQFGDRTDDEMCWAALMFYPAQKFSNTLFFDPQDAWTAALPCLASSVHPPLSGCATAYLADPFGFWLGQAAQVNATMLCNVMTAANRTYIDELQARFWGGVDMCPPCGQTSNCTIQQLLEYGHSLCPSYCEYQGVSAYPDVSIPPVNYTHRTGCDGESEMAHNFMSTFPSLPACSAKGNLSSTKVQEIAASVLPDQPACPNGAIKAFVTACSTQDLPLSATSSSCRETCRTAASALNVSFHSMVPVPSADQRVQCLRDYNATWGTFSGSTAQWATVETRIKAGALICLGAGTTNSALFSAPSIVVGALLALFA